MNIKKSLASFWETLKSYFGDDEPNGSNLNISLSQEAQEKMAGLMQKLNTPDRIVVVRQAFALLDLALDCQADGGDIVVHYITPEGKKENTLRPLRIA